VSPITGFLKKIRLLVFGILIAATPQPPGQSLCFFDGQSLISAGYQIAEKGCTLFVDLDNCNMIVIMDGKPLKAYPVSGGASDSPSPVGTWKVTEIANWGEGFGGSWIGLNVPWGKYGIHGTVAPWAVGEYNASHGCIRMKDADVDAVKKLVRPGTVVHIKQDAAPFRKISGGMVGSDVQRTQKMLKRLGYYHGSADGIFGDRLESAVRRFQKDNRLYQDGIVGRRTYDRIRALSGK
jgi:hypothetical protein